MTDNLLAEIIQWDVRTWSKALHYWDAQVDWNNIENALELGGRQGGLSLWIALKGKKITCSDLSNISKTAAQLHSKHNCTSLITYQDIDATNIPYENHFDLIVYKSILGGLGKSTNFEKQQRAINEIYKSLKPGGKMLFAENISASQLHHFLRKRFTDWADYWQYFSLNDFKDFTKEFNSVHIRTNGFLATFGRNEKQRKLLSNFDDYFFNRLCPDNWKYMAYGIAVK